MLLNILSSAETKASQANQITGKCKQRILVNGNTQHGDQWQQNRFTNDAETFTVLYLKLLHLDAYSALLCSNWTELTDLLLCCTKPLINCLHHKIVIITIIIITTAIYL